MSSFLSGNQLERKANNNLLQSRSSLSSQVFLFLSGHICVDLTSLLSNMNTPILTLFHVNTVVDLPCTCQSHVRPTKVFHMLTILRD